MSASIVVLTLLSTYLGGQFAVVGSLYLKPYSGRVGNSLWNEVCTIYPKCCLQYCGVSGSPCVGQKLAMRISRREWNWQERNCTCNLLGFEGKCVRHYFGPHQLSLTEDWYLFEEVVFYGNGPLLLRSSYVHCRIELNGQFRMSATSDDVGILLCTGCMRSGRQRRESPRR